jgi:hypothetical protein
MANYYVNEAVLDLPERPFLDKTIHALEAELPSDEKLTVFVHRVPIEGDKSLRELVDENIALNQTRLPAFAVLDEAQADVGGLPGIVMRTSWRIKREKFYQRQVHVVVAGKLMVFAVTTSLDEQAACDETFDSILQTITWRAG